MTQPAQLSQGRPVDNLGILLLSYPSGGPLLPSAFSITDGDATQLSVELRISENVVSPDLAVNVLIAFWFSYLTELSAIISGCGEIF